MRAFLLALQGVALAVVAVGVGLIYLPAGMIVAGLAGVAVIERQT